jgi:hypothetical protein
MSSSNSSEMEDQITVAFSSVMDEVMSIVQVEEVVAATTSLSIQWPKRRRRYVNRDREVAHFRLQHDYFDGNYVYPHHISVGDILCG